MRILIVAATSLEVPRLACGPHGRHHIDLVVTGVGMVATAAGTARAIATGSYDLAFNFGVCGSFDPSLAPGAVVHVIRDELSELGVEDGERFVSMEDLGLVTRCSIDNFAPPRNSALQALPVVRGITVNTAHGHPPSIAAVMERLKPQVESMEGAAFAYACSIGSVPYAQVRAVSNRIERRNRDAWRMDLAIHRLNEAALTILDQA
jgi:futalosine hydrolase